MQIGIDSFAAAFSTRPQVSRSALWSACTIYSKRCGVPLNAHTSSTWASVTKPMRDPNSVDTFPQRASPQRRASLTKQRQILGVVSGFPSINNFFGLSTSMKASENQCRLDEVRERKTTAVNDL